MPRPEALERYWNEHPDMAQRVGRRPEPPRPEFPENGTLVEQEQWFRREFLRLAKGEKDAKEKAALLRLAYQTLPKRNGKAAGDAGDMYAEHLRKLAEASEKKLEAERKKKP